MNSSNISKMRSDYVKNIYVKQIFSGWVAVLNRLKRKRILNESALLIRTTNLTEHSFRALASYA